MLDSLDMFDNGFADVAAMTNDSSCRSLPVDTLQQLHRRDVVQGDDQQEASKYRTKMADSGNNDDAYGMKEMSKWTGCVILKRCTFIFSYHYANSK